ncbi:MAG: hypothetical protein IJ939_04350 [Clostridia bacterium]|nr:hypothetical protein [Clostridia bacterium]
MKITDKKKFLLSIALTCLCLVFSAAFIMFGIKLIPNAITYTASTSDSIAAPYHEGPNSCRYDSISDINETGPFTISADGEDIYISFEKSRLYRIKARLSEFPASDREIIQSGIEISDRASLFEIAEYMES